jgi:hypothetical protein
VAVVVPVALLALLGGACYWCRRRSAAAEPLGAAKGVEDPAAASPFDNPMFARPTKRTR